MKDLASAAHAYNASVIPRHGDEEMLGNISPFLEYIMSVSAATIFLAAYHTKDIYVYLRKEIIT